MVSYERFLTSRIIINNQYNVLMQVLVVHLEQKLQLNYGYHNL